MVSAFWSEQCPTRGAALTHAHWDKCSPEAHPGEPSGHLPFQCCHCRGMDPGARGTIVGNSVPPPLDVPQRLRDIGIMGTWQEMPDGTLVHIEDPSVNHGFRQTPPPRYERTDDTLVEPRMVSGQGPQGPVDAPGRGPLTPAQQARIRARAGWQQWLDRSGTL